MLTRSLCFPQRVEHICCCGRTTFHAASCSGAAVSDPQGIRRLTTPPLADDEFFLYRYAFLTRLIQAAYQGSVAGGTGTICPDVSCELPDKA